MSCCHVCGEIRNPMKRCTRCHNVMYCSRECQIKNWPEHRVTCIPENNKNSETEESTQMSHTTELPVEARSVNIVVKANKTKYNIAIPETWNGERIMNKITETVKIPLDKMKLIHKGRKLDATIIKTTIRNKVIYQAIGEKNEDESGLDTEDILTLMKQMSVDRNTAVKALRQSDNSDLVDAIIWLGNR
ncbi:uncharacterized protein LOC141905051 [Tubulanus polymorphus]|uniref:uncharacterized protein LOC141905051 n=1 Tax=Tubulanus polymorphus TaxID=672921 RepID=UPI003DA22B28